MEYCKRCDDLQVGRSPDGKRLYLRRGTRGRCRSYPLAAGNLLLSLNGRNQPRAPGMTRRQLWQWLCRFERDGFLQAPDPLLLEWGSVILCFPCRKLRSRPIGPLCWLYNRLIALGWLPLLGLLFWQMSSPDGLTLPHSTLTFRQSLLWGLACNLPLLVLHELAHAAAARYRGMPVSGFGVGLCTLMPCAAVLLQTMEYAPARVRREVLAAGPQCNLALGAALLLVCSRAPAWMGEYLYLAGVISLVLGLVNLLPVTSGLDGAQILRTFPALARIQAGDWQDEQEFICWGSYRLATAAGLAALLVYQAVSLLVTVEGVIGG